ncbi:MFS-type transporter SLC18B1-like [Cimex lectularius]|uniref:Major facilitator superfamily (MFS) profile domain-containing protein n=1 Tax=Cimex lectularius TaxID=79782 RepID=A0A8I6RI43_CIMLE|nr:MFS-type transporter SLC18B1-like [Cimex lectularius]
MVFKHLASFNRRQILTLITFGIADFCNAICVSLQAPFYPREAEKKGATATEYGLVFGIFELTVFLISPLYGQHLNRIGPKVLFNAGIFTTGICAILFGFLDKIDGHVPFITLSLVIRTVEAMGNAAFLTASFAIIAKEFPNNVATTFASLETFFGLGLIVGPTVGGALYEVGGYTTPFVILGSMLFLSAVMTAFVLPDHADHEHTVKQNASLTQVLRIPGVLLAAGSIVVTSMSIGFISATLEPHLRQFSLSAMVLGLMFVINGGTYAVTAPFWGWLCDKKIEPKTASLMGCILIMVGFLLIGPAPFISNQTNFTLTIIGLVAHGLGIAALLVSSFTDALRTSIAHGFENNLETYGLISGLWTSTFALGAFIGPSIAGIFYDSWGFPHASMSIVGLATINAIVVVVFIIMFRPRKMYKEIGNSADNILVASKNGGLPDIGNQKGLTKPILASTTSIPCERPPGMSGIIACNSYKNRHGIWHRKDSNALVDCKKYSASFTILDPRRNRYETIP